MDLKKEPADEMINCPKMSEYQMSEKDLESLNIKEEPFSNNKVPLHDLSKIKVELKEQLFKVKNDEDFFEESKIMVNNSDVNMYGLSSDDAKVGVLIEEFYLPSIKTETDTPDFVRTQPSSSKTHNDLKCSIKIAKKTSYECPVCFKRFLLLWKRNKHFNLHFGFRSAMKPQQSTKRQINWRLSEKRRKRFNRNLATNIVTCNHCGKLFSRRKDFLLHTTNYAINFFASNKKIPTPIFTNSSLLISAEQKPFQCDICLKRFSRKNHLTCHKQRHDLKEMFECEICFKKFIYQYNLTYHMRYHTGENLFTCTICYKSFSREDRLNQHMPLHSEERLFKEKKVYQCDICPRQFMVKHNLMLHVRVHNDYRPYKCEICLKYYVSHSRLMLHKRCHATERPFKCDVCGKRFIEKAGLTRHMHSHTGEKPFECEICFKKFQRNYYLNSHRLSHTGDRPFKCEICSKFFRDRSNLNRHMLCHSGKKSHKCDICGKLFRDGTGLTRHKRCHSGERPHTCEVCLRAFREKCALTRHMMSHTGEKPYECKVCSKRFRQIATLNKHSRTHNKKPTKAKASKKSKE